MRRINNYLLLLYFFPVFFSCNRPSEGSRKAGEHIKNQVVAIVETEPVPQSKNEDSADDPAIWVNKKNSEKSVIIGTDKKGGLVTYDLDGKLLNYYSCGAINNTDLRYDFQIGENKFDILASSNRTSQSIILHKISEGGVLEEIHARTIKLEMQDEVYGLCMYKSPKTGNFFVFVNSKAGEIEQWELFETKGKIDAKLVRSLKLDSQPEGMVADDEMSIVYIGEELAGIHKFNAEPDGSIYGELINLSTEENKNIRYDIEGLAIYKTDSLKGYLLASAQGNYSYAIFERQGNNKYLCSFRIIDGKIDGVEETDGIEVCNVAFGEKFPKGIFAVQDGFNYEGKKLMSQNFKLISWEDIELFLK